ncbi:1778_t:CDS:2, partial [Racocetra persica]
IWITEQIDDAEVEKELYFACEQYLIQQDSELINSQSENKENLQEKEEEVFMINIMEEAPDDAEAEIAHTICNSQAYDEWQSACERSATWISQKCNNNSEVETELYSAPDYSRRLISSQENDGSFSLHDLISEHLQISAAYEQHRNRSWTYENGLGPLGESIKHYVCSPRLKRCDAFIWNTAFTIIYFNIVLNKYESEWRTSCERAIAWISEQINDSESEKELYYACEQYLFELGSDILDNDTETQTCQYTETICTNSIHYGSNYGILSSIDMKNSNSCENINIDKRYVMQKYGFTPE